VVVPDRQLSLAIGKEGQNARLAAKLTGWRIDIKSQSAYDEYLESLSPEERAALEAPRVLEATVAVAVPDDEAVPAAAAAVEAGAAPVAVAEAPVAESAGVAVAQTSAEPAAPQIRFAEEILTREREAPGKKDKARSKKDDEAEKPKKGKRQKRVIFEAEDEDEEFDYTVQVE
jgi:N utilization substance protein A